jgi:hypothetical protein
MMMKRAQDLAGITAFCTLSLLSLLGGCTHQDATGAASAASAPSAGTDIAQLSAADDDLPVVVITASRPTAKPIVLSESESRAVGK